VALGSAYEGSAEGWDGSAGPVYRPFARSMVASSPVALAACSVLDVGSGTGAVAEAAKSAGARVVAVDRSLGMLQQGHRRGPGGPGRPWPAVAADALALPFADAAFDAACAGFLLNHLSPLAALGELARVVRPGGVVLASTWALGPDDPVKSALEALATSWGWVPPLWYREMKTGILPISGDPQCLAATACQAGLVDVHAKVHFEFLGHLSPHQVVAYRLAVPQVASWASKLGLADQAEFFAQAVGAVRPFVGSWTPAAVLLVGRKRTSTKPAAGFAQQGVGVVA
jgi:SAM-dependent methyltransferase